MPDPLNSLLGITNADLERDVSLANYTTWRVGGPARFMLWVGSKQALVDLLRVVGEHELPLLVLGNGSNLLVSERGFDGVVLRLKGELSRVEPDGDMLLAGGGALLSSAATEAYRGSLTGLEFTFGIPGTVGGAVMMNAGAFSRSIVDVLVEVDTVATGGEELLHQRFNARYRQPLVPEDEIVTGVRFNLEGGESGLIRKLMDEVRDRRRATQPWGMSTAGSVFKNPTGGHAGQLIDQCGLKGRSIGGALVSEIHANFVINRGDARASDIKGLMELMAAEVRSRFGVELEPEVRLVGFKEE